MWGLVAASAVTTVFLASAAAKWRNAANGRKNVLGLGLPPWTAPVIARFLPFVETAVAVSLLVRPDVGGWMAVALLLSFAVVVGPLLLQGRRVPCGCFGSLSRGDVSWVTLARIGVLLALAVMASQAGAAAVPALSLHPAPGAAALLLGALAGAAISAADLIDVRRTTDGSAGLLSSSLTRPDGRPAKVADCHATGRRHIVLFLSAGCGSCQELLPALRRWQHCSVGDELSVTTVVVGSAREADALFPQPSPGCVLVDADGAAADGLGIAMTPAALALGLDGAVASGPVFGEQAIRAAVADLLCSGDRAASLAEVSDLSPQTVLSPWPYVSQQRDEDSLVLHDERTGAAVLMEGTGRLIWSCLDGSSTVGQVADDLAGAFGAPVATVLDDVLVALATLAEQGLVGAVVPVSSPAPPGLDTVTGSRD